MTETPKAEADGRLRVVAENSELLLAAKEMLDACKHIHFPPAVFTLARDKLAKAVEAQERR